MTREDIHVEGAKCVKKAQVYIDGLQICPEDMREEYVFQIVAGVVGYAFAYWFTRDNENSFADTLLAYEKVYRWVREDMVRQGCKYYPSAEEYMKFMHHLGRTLVNL